MWSESNHRKDSRALTTSTQQHKNEAQDVSGDRGYILDSIDPTVDSSSLKPARSQVQSLQGLLQGHPPQPQHPPLQAQVGGTTTMPAASSSSAPVPPADSTTSTGSTSTTNNDVSVTAVVHEAPNPNPGAVAPYEDSVLPDLMTVYENMKRSSTPYHNPNSSSSMSQQQQLELLQHSSNAAALSWGFPNASSGVGSGAGAYPLSFPTVPSVPAEAYAVMMDGATAHAMSGSLDHHQSSNLSAADEMPMKTRSSDAAAAATTASASSSSAAAAAAPPGGGRSLRKRVSKEESSVASSRSAASTSVDNHRGGHASSSGGGGGSGGGAKRRKASKDNDGRWSKRFTWPEELHRDFVAAIFDVGLKHSSPSSILEYMTPNEKLNSERIKSHLQKYRLHRTKSKEAFMSSYAATLHRLQEGNLASGDAPPGTMEGGEVAAHLTYTSANAPDDDLTGDAERPDAVDASAARSGPPAKPKEGTLILPRLTEEEKQSPIGTSMGYLMGLFFSLTQQLVARRAEQEKEQAAAAAAALANSRPAIVYDASSTASTSAAAAAAAGSGASVGQSHVPSTRSNLEENTMMKREMQSQMAFQNKMRALKLEELRKWRRTTSNESSSPLPSDPSQLHAFQPPQSTAAHASLPQHPHYSHPYHSHPQHLDPSTSVPLTSSALPMTTGSSMDPAGSYSLDDGEGGDSTYAMGGDNDHDGGGGKYAASSQHLMSPSSSSSHHHHQPLQPPQQGAGELHDPAGMGPGTGNPPGAGAGGGGGGPGLLTGRNRALSFGVTSEEFWNSDVLDDQLFEFLMDN